MSQSRGRSTVYDVSCTDCSFSRVVEGDGDEVIAVIHAHQEGVDDASAPHFVDFEADQGGRDRRA